MPEFDERYATAADGVELYARDYPSPDGGGRLPVVCIHGQSRNSRDFENIAPWIAGLGHRVIAVDIRGRGKSGFSPDPMHYLPRIYAKDVAAQLRALDIGRAIFLGTSMGGIIAMALAARRSRLVAGAILNDVGPEVGQAGIERISSYVGLPVEMQDWPDAHAYVRRVHEGVFPAMDQAMVETIARRLFREGDDGRPVLDYDFDIAKPIQAGKLTAPKWVAWGLFRWLARRPVLVLRGEKSDILERAIADRMTRVSRNVSLVEIADVGHAPSLDEPSARSAIAAFLGDIAAR